MRGIRERVGAGVVRLPEAAGATRGATDGVRPPLRIALLGDSSAAGVGAPDHELALAGQLAAALTALTGRAVSWRVVARSSATARVVRADLLPSLVPPGDPGPAPWRPDLVVVVVGVNDATRLRRPRAFRRDVVRLGADVRSGLGREVPLLFTGLPPVHRFTGLPAWVRLPLGGHARLLDHQLAALVRHAPAAYHVRTEGLPEAGADGRSWLAEDGFHPGQDGYRAWGRLLAARIATLAEVEPGLAAGGDREADARAARGSAR